MPGNTTDELLPSERARFDEVCRFGQDKREQIAETVALSFADDPIWKWIYDATETLPLETGIGLGRMLVAQSMATDEIHGFRDYGAVALWTAPVGDTSYVDRSELEARRDERGAPYAVAFAEQIGERISLTMQLGEAMRSHRPEEPHWYLGILGTHPDRQNQGLGSRVLQTMLDRCDQLGVPTFLESSNPRNYGFYQRHGFVQVDELTVVDSPPLLGFWRAARRN